MVYYFYAARSAREALKRVFQEELDAPGARGRGRWCFAFFSVATPRAYTSSASTSNSKRFGAPPTLHVVSDASS